MVACWDEVELKMGGGVKQATRQQNIEIRENPITDGIHVILAIDFLF